MKIPDEQPLFSNSQGPRSNPYRMLLWAILIMAAISALRGISSGEIEPLFQATPTPTRQVNSFRLEGDAYFKAGDLDAAIQAYTDALEIDPENTQVLAQLARLQIYSSSLLTLGPQRVRLAEGLANIQRAVELDPTSSDLHATLALALDWNADAAGSVEERDSFLNQALESAVRATQIDSQNPLALAYRAEVLADRGNWIEARPLAELAVEQGPTLMDTHRVFAYVLESTGFYSQAIEEYQKASEIEPNYTYLYIKIGQNYRVLELYDQALEYFEQAAMINVNLDIQDPLPFLAIAKTYSRQGEFFIAALNAEKALDYDPVNADIYGQLGIIYFRNRNYEASVPVLRCATLGCTQVENEIADVSVTGRELDDATVVYYYTYGSVMAALGMCDEAIPILENVGNLYRDNQDVLAIVEESLNICDILGDS